MATFDFNNTTLPENMLLTAESLISGGNEVEALKLIHSYLNLKKAKIWSHALEQLMKYHLQFSIQLKMYEYIKDGLTAYRNITQASNVSSLEAVLRRYLEIVEQKFEATIKGIKDPVSLLQEIETEDNPEDFYFSVFDQSYNQQKREVQCAWKLLIDAYKHELDLICKNRKLEEMYQNVAKKAFEKCTQFKKRKEFQKFSSLISKHQQQNIKNYSKTVNDQSNQIFALNISLEETNNRLLELRIKQIELAKKLSHWKIILQILEDINILLSKRKSVSRQILMFYYENLADVYWNAGYYHLHTIAYYNFIANARKIPNSQVNQVKAISRLILAALSIQKDSQEKNLSKNEFQKNFDLLSSNGNFLDIEEMILSLKCGQYQEVCTPPVKSLFKLVTENSNILKFAQIAENCFKELQSEYPEYLPLIENTLVSQVVTKISKLYKTMSFESFKKYIGFLDYSKCEKFIFFQESIKVDQDANMLIFNQDIDQSHIVTKSLVEFYKKLETSERTLNKIMMVNNRDWDKLVHKQVTLAKNYLLNAQEDIREMKEQIKSNAEKRENEEQRMASMTAKQTEEELERIHELAKQRRIEQAEIKKYTVIKRRVASIIELDKNAQINGNKLSNLKEAEIRVLELEDLIEVEKAISIAVKTKQDNRQLRLFRNKDYIGRELRQTVCEKAVKKAQSEVLEKEAIIEKVRKNHENEKKLRDLMVNARQYMNRRTREILEKRKEQNEAEIEDYQKNVTDLFSKRIFEIARKKYLKEQEEVKAEEEKRKNEEEINAIRNGGMRAGGNFSNDDGDKDVPLTLTRGTARARDLKEEVSEFGGSDRRDDKFGKSDSMTLSRGTGVGGASRVGPGTGGFGSFGGGLTRGGGFTDPKLRERFGDDNGGGLINLRNSKKEAS